MDKTIAAFVLTLICLVSVIILMVLGVIPADVGLPIVTLTVGAAIGYLFPAPGQ
jgi:fucose permease